jgi:hypothetical protein
VSGLLQRLASQAVGASGPRIRSAERMRAQVPIVMAGPAAGPAAGISLGLDASGHADEAPLPHTPLQTIDVPADRGAGPRANERQIGNLADASQDHEGHRLAPHIPVTARTPDHASVMPREATHEHSVAAAAPIPLLGQSVLPPRAVQAASSIRFAKPPETRPLTPTEPTEVHVHIGRIEVTAVHTPAAPPRKREGSTRQTVPLAEYLARRRPS